MWKEIQRSPPLFLSFQRKCNYHILITDYIKIWEVYYTEVEFLNCLKESNYGLEIKTSELIKNGTEILSNANNHESLKVTHNGSFLTVSIMRLFGYPLHLTMKLTEGSSELFFQEVTQKLLETIKDLRCSEQKLRKLLKSKDEEINEYKLLGGQIRYTALPPYNDEVHMGEHSAYDVNFGEAEIPNNLIEMKVNVSRNKSMEGDVDNKPIIKKEPATQENKEEEQESIKIELQPIIPVRTKKRRMLKI